MSFPASPSNGQIVTVNNIAYVYAIATNSWTRSVQAANVSIGAVLSDNYKYANGAPFISTTIANTNEIVANISGGADVGMSLTATGVSAGNYGSATSIPTIVVDSKGRVTSITSNAVSTTISLTGTSGTGSIAGGGTLTFASTNGVTASVSSSTITIGTPQDVRTTASPTFTGLQTTTSVSTNFSTANAVITGGSLNSTPIGASTASTGAFTTLTATTTATRNGRNLMAMFTGTSAPASPINGDEWYNSGSDILYKYVFDGTNSQWVDLTSPLYNASTSATASTLALRDTNGNLTATNFIGVASSAKYADLAEVYTSDAEYAPGTVVVFGGTEEVTVTTRSHDTRVAGVVSTNPAYLMNSEATGLPIAFTGRVPCLVNGPVSKGDLLVTSSIPGVAQRIDNSLYNPGCVIGKALGENASNTLTTIEVVVGRF